MAGAMSALPWQSPRTGKFCTSTKRFLLARGPIAATTGILRTPPRHIRASRVPCAPGASSAKTLKP